MIILLEPPRAHEDYFLDQVGDNTWVVVCSTPWCGERLGVIDHPNKFGPLAEAHWREKVNHG